MNDKTNRPTSSPTVRVLGGGDARARDQHYDSLIFAIGYEQRSHHVASALATQYSRALGIRFGVQEELSFPSNLAWAQAEASVQIRIAADALAVSREVLAFLGEVDFESNREVQIAVDVSSFPRTSMVAIYSALWNLQLGDGSLVITFLYSFAEFTPPPSEHGPVIDFGAVSPEFSGVGEAELGLATLIGLGYESELALAAQQVLDPALTWLGVPQSLDKRFDAEVQNANEILVSIVEPTNIWKFAVDDPFSTFVELETLVHGLQRTHNVVLVPLGPKLLTVACLLVASIHRGVGVWRLSPGGLRTPRDQIAAGPIAFISAQFATG